MAIYKCKFAMHRTKGGGREKSENTLYILRWYTVLYAMWSEVIFFMIFPDDESDLYF